MNRRDFIKTTIYGITGLSIYGYIEPVKIEFKEVNLDLGFDKRILFITDTHFHGVGFLDENLLKLIEKYVDEVDVILLGGDQYDEFTPNLNVLKDFLNLISGKAFYVNGNHEHSTQYKISLDETDELYEKYSVESINNKSIWIDNIKIGGVDWIYDNREIAEKYVSKVGRVDIMVSHTPDTFSYAPYNYKLMLAGHTHGGQILNGLLVTASKLGYISGLYRDGERRLYVSRGAGEMIPIRILTPREISLIRV